MRRRLRGRGVLAAVVSGVLLVAGTGGVPASAAPASSGAQSPPVLTPPPPNFKPECPRTLPCVFDPAAYAANSPAPDDYGNYNLARRPTDLAINQIVIHVTEGSLASAIKTFQTPTGETSANYIVGLDGSVTQMVRDQDIAYHAGNWYVNMHSIGIEHEGYSESDTMTPAQYRSSATLVKWLAAQYHLRLDRSTVVGHDNVPAKNDAGMAGMHWDPGPYWDWNRYLQLLGAAGPSPRPGTSGAAVTIYPDYRHNRQALHDCSTSPCTAVPAMPTNFLTLRSAPSASAALLKDPYLPATIAGTDRQDDWGDKASTGITYAVADRVPGWTAIWYSGRKAWFADNGHVTRRAAALTATPRGSAAIPVYGRPLPEASAGGWAKIPEQFRVAQVSDTKYTIQPGQRYVVTQSAKDDYAEGCKLVTCDYPGDNTVVIGQDRYLRIDYNHRFFYVQAADVRLHRVA